MGCECGLFLAQHGCQVTIVEMLPELLQTEEIYSIKIDLQRMLAEAGIKILTGAQATKISEGSVTVKSGDSSGELLEADSVVVAVGMAPRREEAHQLAGECADVHVIGDCVAPRRIRDAVVEGDLAGRLV